MKFVSFFKKFQEIHKMNFKILSYTSLSIRYQKIKTHYVCIFVKIYFLYLKLRYLTSVFIEKIDEILATVRKLIAPLSVKY